MVSDARRVSAPPVSSGSTVLYNGALFPVEAESFLFATVHAYVLAPTV
jgi:hypothetical protein